MDDVYEVTVNGPGGGSRKVLLPRKQVEFFAGKSGKNHYATAVWLAYCDLWARDES